MSLSSSSRTCTKCKRELVISAFNCRSDRGGVPHSWCARCRASNMKEWRAKQTSAQRSTRYRRENLGRYGISVDEYQKMFDRQDGLCAICNNPPTQGRGQRLSVDHCHETKELRGLLCHACNTSLGGFKDNPDLLRKAANYCEQYVANSAFVIV